jgi:hypothetical protein
LGEIGENQEDGPSYQGGGHAGNIDADFDDLVFARFEDSTQFRLAAARYPSGGALNEAEQVGHRNARKT